MDEYTKSFEKHYKDTVEHLHCALCLSLIPHSKFFKTIEKLADISVINS